MRRWWRAFHRYVGLSVGLLLVLLGLTGSLITYQYELDRWLNPALLRVAPGPARLPFAVLQARAQAALPHGTVLGWARLAPDDAGALSWFFEDAEGSRWELAQDPLSGRVLGQRRSDTHALAWVYEFHATLLSGVVGNVVLGLVALLVLLLVAAGVTLWWPRHGRWRQALTVKTSVGPARLHFDLHRATGAYAAPLLLLSAFTGIYMALPPVMNAMVSLVAPVTEITPVQATAAARRLTLDDAVAAAQRAFPGTLPKVLVLPTELGSPYEVNLYRPGDRLTHKSGEWTAFIDPATGATLRLDGPPQRQAGDWFIAWMFPLHNGEAFGAVSRALTCFLGLVPLLLAITGVSMWWRRRLNRRRALTTRS
jgi:uncharacterized iron-regulated membrane protein